MTSEIEKLLRSVLHQRLKDARKRAKCRHRKFDLNEDDLVKMYIKQKGLCYISGIPMSLKMYKHTTLSLDRIDSSRGYTLDNVCLVCWIANQMKNNMKLEDFVIWCKYVVDLRCENNIMNVG